MPAPIQLRARHLRVGPGLVSQAPVVRYDWVQESIAPVLAMVGGNHALTVVRKHTAGNLALAGGVSSKIASKKHTAGNLALAGGADHFFIGRAHTAGNLALAGGTSTKTTSRKHTAANLALAGGTATFVAYRVVVHSAGHITLGGRDLTWHTVLGDKFGGRTYPEEGSPMGMVRVRDLP